MCDAGVQFALSLLRLLRQDNATLSTPSAGPESVAQNSSSLLFSSPLTLESCDVHSFKTRRANDRFRSPLKKGVLACVDEVVSTRIWPLICRRRERIGTLESATERR